MKEMQLRGEVVDQFVRIISKNSPQRDEDSKPHEIKRKGVVISPFPGNLKINGNQIVESENGYAVLHGYEPARYALYANKNSRKTQYIEKSVEEFRGFLFSEGWEESAEIEEF